MAGDCVARRGRISRANRRLLGIEPLEPRLVLDSTVVLNEIMYHPADDVGDTLEWVELYNQLGVDMDISGWSIQDAVEFEFPQQTVIPGRGYLVVAGNPDQLQAQTGFAGALGPFNGQLSNGGEQIDLVNNSGRLMDTVDYDDDHPWPVAPDGSGVSLAKIDPDSASEPTENWTFSHEVGGTPGTINFPTSLPPPETSTVLPIDATWKYEASGTDLETAWREPGFDNSGWDSTRAPSPSVLITETGTNAPDYFEVQNVCGDTVDTSGWVVAANNARYRRINDVHSPLWTFPPSMAADDVLYRPDTEEDDIFWRTEEDGWVMIVDDDGNVVDFVVWGYSASDIASLQVDVGGFVGITVDDAWIGPAVPAEGTPTNSLQRTGDSDHDGASNWAFTQQPSPDLQNADLTTPFRTMGIELTPGQTTYYFSTQFDFDNAPEQTELLLDMIVDDGAVFYLNGAEIYRYNMPLGEVAYDTLASTQIEEPSFTHDISIPTGALIQGTNVLAVEVHQVVPGDIDIAFGAELSAVVWPPSWQTIYKDLAFNEVAAAGEPQFWVELVNFGDRILELGGYVIGSSGGDAYVMLAESLGLGEFRLVTEAELGFDAAAGDRLFLYRPNGNDVLDGVRVDDRLRGRSPEGTGHWLYPDVATPAAANTFAFHDEIVINEIMYHHHPWTNDPVQPYLESQEEWIELYNRGTTTIDLTGWSLREAIDFDFPADTQIPSDGYLLVAKNAADLAAKFPAVADVIVGDYDRRLNDRTDRIVLKDANGNPADVVEYFDAGRWPSAADGGGSSLELRDPRADNNVPEAWAASDESDSSAWTTYTYRATALNTNGIYDLDRPLLPDELYVGLLNDGELLIDDISLIEAPDAPQARQLILFFNAGPASRGGCFLT